MNLTPFAVSFIRATVQQVTDGAFPAATKNEWAIYQHDLEMARVLTKTPAHTSNEIRRLEPVHCPCRAETRTA
jgi:hypothetical protein